MQQTLPLPLSKLEKIGNGENSDTYHSQLIYWPTQPNFEVACECKGCGKQWMHPNGTITPKYHITNIKAHLQKCVTGIVFKSRTPARLEGSTLVAPSTSLKHTLLYDQEGQEDGTSKSYKRSRSTPRNPSHPATISDDAIANLLLEFEVIPPDTSADSSGSSSRGNDSVGSLSPPQSLLLPESLPNLLDHVLDSVEVLKRCNWFMERYQQQTISFVNYLTLYHVRCGATLPLTHLLAFYLSDFVSVSDAVGFIIWSASFIQNYPCSWEDATELMRVLFQHFASILTSRMKAETSYDAVTLPESIHATTFPAPELWPEELCSFFVNLGLCFELEYQSSLPVIITTQLYDPSNLQPDDANSNGGIEKGKGPDRSAHGPGSSSNMPSGLFDSSFDHGGFYDGASWDKTDNVNQAFGALDINKDDNEADSDTDFPESFKTDSDDEDNDSDHDDNDPGMGGGAVQNDAQLMVIQDDAIPAPLFVEHYNAPALQTEDNQDPPFTDDTRKAIIAAFKNPSSTAAFDAVEDLGDSQDAEEYANEISSHMKDLEIQTAPRPNYMDNQPEINWKMRQTLVSWLIQVLEEYDSLQETLYLTINILDRFCSHRKIPRNQYQLLGVASYLIAAKYAENHGHVPTVKQLCKICCDSYPESDFKQMELVILDEIHFVLGHPTAEAFLRADCRFVKCVEMQSRALARYIMEFSVIYEEFIVYMPSVVASASIILAESIRGNHDYEYDDSALSSCVIALAGKLKEPPACLAKKFASQKWLNSAGVVKEWIDKDCRNLELIGHPSLNTRTVSFSGLPSPPPSWPKHIHDKRVKGTGLAFA
ncbi:hypothetical protein SmJEL517_g03708 [Synchytrium microbalum]|uniref:Cyclin N-terminal domain-containing protein n=1 Tax=Synchytrium microbalum TaxID=1806994 RepID=A0A507C7B2_9FUNG|nr:uncharacterized protein SmJEL517_g03708 [Synchytrium microbalum]TPX33375.1 hypothetical protein SmJEL517_g03708 [Synchytrium microbalum]